ncbi:HAD family hydrolase [Paenibacillus xylanexedens]|uniref:HAD family hydrolase n=1 Tax=Paenibacillus xylanexedens TaxID=528191 RepID=UPI003D07DE60
MLTRSIKNLTWDLDGTLVNSWPLHVESMKWVARQLEGTKLTTAKILLGNKGGLGESLMSILAEEKPDISLAIQLYEDCYINLIHDNPSILYDGVKETLVRLKEYNIVQSLYTGSTRKITEASLLHCNIYDFFDWIVTSNDCLPKPSPDGMKYIIENCGKDASLHGLIGDSSTDMRIAMQTSVVPFYAAWGKKSNKIIKDSAICLNNPLEIIVYLRK